MTTKKPTKDELRRSFAWLLAGLSHDHTCYRYEYGLLHTRPKQCNCRIALLTGVFEQALAANGD